MFHQSLLFQCCYFFILLLATFQGIDAFNNFADVNCGLRGRTSRVVGGSNAGKGEFPWMVSITRRGGHFCGGTLISNKFILTAGHCLCTGIGADTLSAKAIKVTVAQHDLGDKSSDAFEIALKSVTIHPGYVCGKASNDIAILEAESELQWTEAVHPACLSSASSDSSFVPIEDRLATVAGWGWTNEDSAKGGRAKILQKAQVGVIALETCRAWFKQQGKKTKIQDTQICAGHQQGGVDACWADSGGPLMVAAEGSGQMVVVGVVSTGIGCARPFLPGLYTRISEYIPWIQEIVRK